MNGFTAWLTSVCFQKPTPEALDLAKDAWKAAYNAGLEASAIIADKAAEQLRGSGCGHEAAAVEVVADDIRDEL